MSILLSCFWSLLLMLFMIFIYFLNFCAFVIRYKNKPLYQSLLLLSLDKLLKIMPSYTDYFYFLHSNLLLRHMLPSLSYYATFCSHQQLSPTILQITNKNFPYFPSPCHKPVTIYNSCASDTRSLAPTSVPFSDAVTRMTSMIGVLLKFPNHISILLWVSPPGYAAETSSISNSKSQNQKQSSLPLKTFSFFFVFYLIDDN